MGHIKGMKLLHNKESELSRILLESAPEGLEIIEGSGGYPVSAYPSVVVTLPACKFEAPAYGPDGELLGIKWVTSEEFEDVIRMPVSWGAVAEYVEFKSRQQIISTPVEE